MTNFAPKLIKLIHSVGKGSRAGDPLKIMEDLEEDLAILISIHVHFTDGIHGNILHKSS